MIAMTLLLKQKDMNAQEIKSYLDSPDGQLVSNKVAKLLASGADMDTAIKQAFNYTILLYTELHDGKTDRAKMFRDDVFIMAKNIVKG